MARSIPKPNPILDTLLLSLLVCELGIIMYTFAKDKQMLYILIAMIVVVALAVRLTKTSFAIGGRWFSRTFLQHLNDPLKKTVALKKWCDQSWQLVIHVSMTIFELYVLRDEKWWQDQTTLWNQGTDTGVFPTQKFSTKLLYITQMAIWIYTAFSCKFLEEIRKDYLVMMTHHVVTIALVTWSYAIGFLPVGVIVLLLHDMTDVPLDMLKMSNYLKMEGVPGLFTSEILFVTTIALWFYYRIYQYPMKLLYTTIWDSREATMPIADAHDFTQLFPHPGPQSWLLFNMLLTTLYCLHIYWGILLVRILIGVVTKGTHNSAKEEYEVVDAMMEILSEAPATIEQSMITEKSIVDELREMLPQMNADLVTLKVVMENLAIRFGMKFTDLKAQWRLQIKALLPEMLDLCDGGVGECNNYADKEGENEDEEADVRPSRQRYRKKRIAVVDASDEEEIDEGSNVDEDDEAGPKGDKSPDATALAERSPEMKRPKKRKSKERFPSAKKIKAVTQLDPPGLGSLKELGRAAGVLNPQVYKLLKRAESTKEAEEVLRERLHDAGINFHGSYPSSRDISAARKKHAKEKELEGIDTNLIISAGRSRRGGRQLISYKENRVGSDLDDDDVDQDDDVNEDAGNSSENESAISGSDSSEASS